MIVACRYVLAVQFLVILTVVRYHAGASFYGVGKLLCVWLAQLPRGSGRFSSESPRGDQFANYNVNIFVQVDCYEQFAVQRCLTRGWMSSSGTLFLTMWSLISSVWSQK